MSPTGAGAEDSALEYLRTRGLSLVTRNYRCRLGEIDLVMREGDTMVFVEVRLRRHSSFGGAAESITAKKQQRILSAARHYLTQFRVLPRCRFDVVLFSGTDPAQWIPDAFRE